jgi:hypothetical protein
VLKKIIKERQEKGSVPTDGLAPWEFQDEDVKKMYFG